MKFPELIVDVEESTEMTKYIKYEGEILKKIKAGLSCTQRVKSAYQPEGYNIVIYRIYNHSEYHYWLIYPENKKFKTRELAFQHWKANR